MNADGKWIYGKPEDIKLENPIRTVRRLSLKSTHNHRSPPNMTKANTLRFPMLLRGMDGLDHGWVWTPTVKA